MSDLSGWMWPLVAVVIGLALGMVLGAVKLRRGRSAAGRDSEHGPASALAAGVGAHGADPGGRPDATPQQRLLERLRSANLQLTSQMKSLAEANSRQMQEREGERQAERLRHEREMEELRQSHASELSHFMNTLVEQIDSLNKNHADQVKALEAEVERARRGAPASSGPGALSGVTRPMPVAPAPAPNPAAAAAPSAGNTRSGGATASDYSVTLPMESFRER